MNNYYSNHELKYINRCIEDIPGWWESYSVAVVVIAIDCGYTAV